MPKVARSPYKAPKVAIFGAGISGLSVAHELIERGFTVHVIEPTESQTEEYTCEIGGMAANQLGRVPVLSPAAAENISRNLSLAAAKDTLPPEDKVIREIVDQRIWPALAQLEMQPLQRRFAITERIAFEKKDSVVRHTGLEKTDPFPSAYDWRVESDDHNITNELKLQSVWKKLFSMYNEYRNELARILDHLFLSAEFDDLRDDVKEKIKASLGPYMCLVRIVGFTDTDGLPEVNRRISKVWAQWVGDALIEINDDRIPCLDRLLIPHGRGAEQPLGDQTLSRNLRTSNRVEFSMIGQTIPGEHGYRFFPSFYRHLFDTMKRTPVFNDRGELTPETAFDQLVSTPDSAVGFSPNRGVVPVKLRSLSSMKDFEKTIEFFREKAEFKPRDLLRLQTHFLKYMTSCKERRSEESEESSFWEYIHADTVNYSDSAARFVDSAPQALVAMSAKETDARTQYNTVIQMLVQNPLDTFAPDLTLNGTTSEAWMSRWKHYLKMRGVNFYIGSLESLKLQQAEDGREEFIPTVSGPILSPDQLVPEFDVITKQRQAKVYKDMENATFSVEECDFFVMALPFEKASQKVWDAYRDAAVRKLHTKFSGPFSQLIEFDKVTGRRLPDGSEIPRYRNPCTGLAINEDDPLRDISGIQYFLKNSYQFIEGHVYYPTSPWALTSISQYSFFRDRVENTGTYIGHQSFDIGDWYQVDPADNGTTAWNSTREELAERTWGQATATLDPDYAKSLIKPKYYHLDAGIKFCIGPNEIQGRMQTIAAFRGNSIVRIIESVPERDYEIILSTDDKKTCTSFKVTAKVGDTVEDICQELCDKINVKGSVAAALFEQPNEVIVSPIVNKDIVTIRINCKSKKPAVIFVNGAEFLIESTGDKIPQKLGNDYVLRRGDSGVFTVESEGWPDRHGRDMSIAVCNADNCVELLRGPRLTVELRSPLEDQRSLAEIPRKALDRAIVMHNENPYIINVPGQGRYRPGFNRGAGEIDYTIDKDVLEESLFRRWVPAGTFMATFTRLTTMEAANESGRHAVNAILRALMSLPVEEGREPLFNGQGKLFGDPCKIWDPEDNELADLDHLKELDQALMRENLPHVLDIFRIIEFIESLPDDVSSQEASNQLQALIEGSARSSLIGLRLLDTGVRPYVDAILALLSGR